MSQTCQDPSPNPALVSASPDCTLSANLWQGLSGNVITVPNEPLKRVYCFSLLLIMHNGKGRGMSLNHSTQKILTLESSWDVVLQVTPLPRLMKNWHNIRGNFWLHSSGRNDGQDFFFLVELLRALVFFSSNLDDGKNNECRWMLIRAMLIWLYLLFREFWKSFLSKCWSQGLGLHCVDSV